MIARLAAAVVFVAVLGSGALAHLMPTGHGTLNVIGAKAYLIVSLPVGAFRKGGGPGAQDGVLTAAELKADEATLRATVRDGLRVEVGGQAATFKTVLLNLPTGAHHAPDQGTEVTVMIVAALPAAGAVTLRSTLWGAEGDTLKIDGTVTVERRIVRREIGELKPGQPSHVFFQGAPEVPAAAPHSHGGRPHSH